MPSILISDQVADSFMDELAGAAPNHDLTILRDEALIGAPLEAVEIACFSWDVFPSRTRPFLGAVKRCPNLKWFHTMSAGVDDPFFQGLLANGVRLTTSSGAQATTIAQSVIMLLLALSRRFPDWFEDQKKCRWNPRQFQDLQERHLLVAGLGPIGLETAKLGQALGMRVTGLRRSPRGDEGFPVERLEKIETILPFTDAMVLALPLTDETRHILNDKRIGLLPDTAYIVNVGRGELIEEQALISALKDNRLGGAGLDVFAIEPLPQDNPLWRLQNTIVLPHTSGSVPENFERTTKIFLENVRRYLAGETLYNEV